MLVELPLHMEVAEPAVADGRGLMLTETVDESLHPLELLSTTFMLPLLLLPQVTLTVLEDAPEVIEPPDMVHA